MAVGDDIIPVVVEAKEKKPGTQLEIISKDYFPKRKGQLGLRTKLNLKNNS